MISWLQTNLQKHFRVVFIVLLVVLIVAFVFTIGNQGPLSGGDNSTAKLRFFETPLNTEAARTQFNRDAQLSATLQRNFRPSSSLPFERATALHIANEHNLPEPNDAELKAYIESLPAFTGPNGDFNAQTYNMMLDSIRASGMYSDSDVRRVLADDYRIGKVREALAGTGFVQESEILDAISQRNAKYSILVAETDLSEYTPEVEITEEMLRKHYDDFSFTYQTPERRVVDYVVVPATQFVEEIKPTEDELITYFEDNIDRYQPKAETPADGEEAVTPEPVTFEEARLAVREDYRLEHARDLALERAHDLVVEIVDKDISNDSSTLNQVISDLGLEVKTSSPFAANETPIGTTWGKPVRDEAFALTEDHFYSDPIQVGNNAVVLFYNSVIEPIIPLFDTLRGTIIGDVRQEEYRKARTARAQELEAKLSDANASEEAFGAAAEEAGLTVTAYSDFSLSEPAEGLSQRLFSPLSQMDAGEVSDFVRTNSENQGAFIYVISKDVPEVDKNDPQYEQIKSSLASLYSRFTVEQYLSKLMLEEQIRAGFASESQAN